MAAPKPELSKTALTEMQSARAAYIRVVAETYQTYLEALRKLNALEEIVGAPITPPHTLSGAEQAPSAAKHDIHESDGEMTAAQAIWHVIETNPYGLPAKEVYEGARQALADHGRKISNHGLYQGLISLEHRGLVGRADGHIFSKSEHSRYLRDVESGSREPLGVMAPTGTRPRSPLYDIIPEALEKLGRPATTTEVRKFIVNKLGLDQELFGKKNRDLHRIVGRLVEQDVLERTDDGGKLMLPNMSAAEAGSLEEQTRH